MGILRRNGTLTDMNRILTTILLGLFIPIYTFAEYDGRMADDPYHKSPTWIYILLVVGLFALIGKLAKGGTHKKHGAVRDLHYPLRQFIKVLVAIGLPARNVMEPDMWMEKSHTFSQRILIRFLWGKWFVINAKDFAIS